MSERKLGAVVVVIVSWLLMVGVRKGERRWTAVVMVVVMVSGC